MRWISVITRDVQDQSAWPPWAVSLVVMVFAVTAALALHELASAVVRRALKRSDEFWRALVVRTRRPTRLAAMLAGLALASAAAPLPAGAGSALRHGLLIAFILLLGWAALTAVDIAAALYLRRYRVDVEDNLLARKHLTQIRILRRAVTVLVVVVTAGLALMTISGVRQWGVSLLAAGGAASLIVGLALQPLLSNLIAGIQIAMTQPIRIDDQIVVEGESGRVEEITGTYVVVRLWDRRRMILPLSYFLQHPFQNWTRDSAALTGAIMVYVDYAAPVAALRAAFEAMVKEDPLWDGQVCALQVTDLKERTMEIRGLVSARNAAETFDLRCRVREKLVAYLQAEHPSALPLERVQDVKEPGPAPAA